MVFKAISTQVASATTTLTIPKATSATLGITLKLPASGAVRGLTRRMGCALSVWWSSSSSVALRIHPVCRHPTEQIFILLFNMDAQK